VTNFNVDSILYLPCSTPEFEARLWEAVIDQPRDWDETEKEYLRRNQGIRESIIDWCRFMNQSSCTDANLEFLRPYWNVEATTKSLTRSGDGSDQTTAVNES
jgi:hypothetical protein